MKKVYAVVSGSYSDYGIDRIFSTEEKAQEFIDVMNNCKHSYAYDFDIEEYELDDLKEKQVYGYAYIWLKDGRLENLYHTLFEKEQNLIKFGNCFLSLKNNGLGVDISKLYYCVTDKNMTSDKINKILIDDYAMYLEKLHNDFNNNYEQFKNHYKGEIK